MKYFISIAFVREISAKLSGSSGCCGHELVKEIYNELYKLKKQNMIS